jgi:hypothetical protein
MHFEWFSHRDNYCLYCSLLNACVELLNLRHYQYSFLLLSAPDEVWCLVAGRRERAMTDLCVDHEAPFLFRLHTSVVGRNICAIYDVLTVVSAESWRSRVPWTFQTYVGRVRI